MEEMLINAVLPYFGCKRSIADVLALEFGEHRAYWDMTCGSLAALFAKPESSHETLCDLNGDVTNLAWVLQSPRFEELYDRCSRAVVSEGGFFEAQARTFDAYPSTPDVTDASIDRAFWYFIKSWWGRNGLAGLRNGSAGSSIAVRFTPGGGHGGVRFRSATESMPAWHRRLRSCIILRRDMFEVLEQIADVPGVVIYVDPPYVKKSGRYVHDFKKKDHARLAEAVRRFKHARVVVSYYDDPILVPLYEGWTKRSIEVTKTLAHAGHGKAGVKLPIMNGVEILYINGPSYTMDATLF